VAGPDFAELIADKVHNEITQANGTIERLIAEAIERELQALVSNLVETSLTERAAEVTAREVKTCSSCGKTRSVADFPPRRNTCRTCRNAATEASRRTRAARATEAPTPLGDGDGSPSTSSVAVDDEPTSSMAPFET
jgi:hypothetical protein